MSFFYIYFTYEAVCRTAYSSVSVLPFENLLSCLCTSLCKSHQLSLSSPMQIFSILSVLPYAYILSYLSFSMQTSSIVSVLSYAQFYLSFPDSIIPNCPCPFLYKFTQLYLSFPIKISSIVSALPYVNIISCLSPVLLKYLQLKFHHLYLSCSIQSSKMSLFCKRPRLSLSCSIKIFQVVSVLSLANFLSFSPSCPMQISAASFSYWPYGWGRDGN